MSQVLVHIPDRNVRVPMRTLTRMEIDMLEQSAPSLDLGDVTMTTETSSAEIRIERVGSEIRIRDTDLGARLEFAQPRDIRKIIARHRGALSLMGALPTEDEVVGKGQKTKAFYLNKKQAIFITAKSETEKATDITIEIIEKFDAYERGARPVPQTREQKLAEAFMLTQEIIKEKDAQIAVLAPKAEALDRIATADGSLSITEAAKALQVRPKDLFDYLSTNGWTYRRAGSGTWLGYQTRTNAGDLAHKVNTVLQADGTERVFEQVKVTPRGLAKLAKLMPGRMVLAAE